MSTNDPKNSIPLLNVTNFGNEKISFNDSTQELFQKVDAGQTARSMMHSMCGGFVQDDASLPPCLRYPYHRGKSSSTQLDADNERKKNDIYSGISYSCDSSLIVWSPLVNIRCIFVNALLKQFGDPVSAHDRWIRDDLDLFEDEWGGIVVVYPTPSIMKKVAHEIPVQHE